MSGSEGVGLMIRFPFLKEYLVQYDRVLEWKGVCLSQHICTEDSRNYYTIRISKARGVGWYKNINFSQYKYIELEAETSSEPVTVQTLQVRCSSLSSRLGSCHVTVWIDIINPGPPPPLIPTLAMSSIAPYSTSGHPVHVECTGRMHLQVPSCLRWLQDPIL